MDRNSHAKPRRRHERAERDRVNRKPSLGETGTPGENPPCGNEVKAARKNRSDETGLTKAADDKTPGSVLLAGDCLTVAAGLSPNSFRLIYLDPPFFTGKTRIGTHEPYRFDDSWPGSLREYLGWLKARLEVIIPLLVPGGSLIVHLDHHAVHYVKVMLDDLLGYGRFVNEIIWHYTGGGRSRRRFSRKHDSLLWYAAGPEYVFNIEAVRVPYKPTSGYARAGIVSAAGKKYLPHPRGTPVDDVWDLPIINPLAAERSGYPTQKPLALLERLIAALTNPGDRVGDFFCGSGTTLLAAARLGRKGLGVDLSPAALACAEKRLRAATVG